MDLSSLIKEINNQKNLIHLRPLNVFTPNGIDPKTVIHIAGDIGKTSLALECVYRNSNKLFLYVDTYFKIKNEETADNMYLFRTNNMNDIILYLNELNPKDFDFIIIDSLQNLSFSEELEGNMNNYITGRYILFQNSLIKILNKCSDLNIPLILLNTLKDDGKPFNLSIQLLYQYSMDLRIESLIKKGDYYYLAINSQKNVYRTYDTPTNNNIILLGKGDD